MTRDPGEGVDADGYLVTGAALANVPAAYRPVIDDCVAALTAFPELDGLYLYGSVATEQARPPDSDLDLLALWTSTASTVDAVDTVDTADRAEVEATVAALSARHAGVVREVGLAQGSVDSLADEAERCFLKHYCVPLAGRDRRAGLPRCRPSRALAAGFAGDLPAILRSIVDAAPSGALAARKVARRLLLGVATIESAAHGGWTTDRATGAALLAEHHPQWTEAAGSAVRMSAGAPGDVSSLLALADWLIRHPDQPAG